MQDVVIVAAKRTAIGSFLGSLRHTKAVDLAAAVLKNILAQKLGGFDASLVDEVVLGQVIASNAGQNPARQAALNAGLSESKTVTNVNLVCGSGLKAIEVGYLQIALGQKEFVLAGGMENMSAAPFYLDNAREGYRMGNQSVIDSILKDALICAFHDYHMGITAENIAKKYQISREEQDAFALSSQQKATQALKSGRFKDEIVPITLKDKKGERIFETDEYIKTDTTLEKLSSLRPAFLKDGSVTAGNASGINDAAAAVLMCSKQKAKELGLPIMATLKAITTAGVAPEWVMEGAAEAAKKVLQKARLSIDDMELIEANEAFAAQSIACMRSLGADSTKVNVNGGAIALGHPVGASGARVVVTLLHEMQKRDCKRALATLCAGGGQGIAAIFERE